MAVAIKAVVKSVESIIQTEETPHSEKQMQTEVAFKSEKQIQTEVAPRNKKHIQTESNKVANY